MAREKQRRLFMIVTDIINTGTDYFPYSTEALAKRNAGRLLKQWMKPDSGIKCDDEAREEVTRLIESGKVEEAIVSWNDFQNEDCSPKAEIAIQPALLDQPFA